MYRSRADLEADADVLRASGMFDPEWYARTYPDVRILGLDPAEHYLKYGVVMRRDPGPEFSTRFYLETHRDRVDDGRSPVIEAIRAQQAGEEDLPQTNFVLTAAADVAAATGDPARGIALAERHLPPDLAYAIAGLRADAELRAGSTERWLAELNGYLAHFDLAGLVLRDGGPMLSRLRAGEGAAPVTDGPLVSVLMAAWNAEETLESAALSVLGQTWRNLELLIVDDASDDGTWAVMQRLAEHDPRVHIARNPVNVGPYVSKNLALAHAEGEYVTGHDADDWALPQRLERHVQAAMSSGTRASMGYMLRMRGDGRFTFFSPIGEWSLDGFARLAAISCLFETRFLKEKVGFWDSVRFGADSEMISRVRTILGEEFRVFPQVGMICLDLHTSLTNDPEHGIRTDTGMSTIRVNYKDAWTRAHRGLGAAEAYLEQVQPTRRYQTAAIHAVPVEDVLAVKDAEWR